MPRDPKPVSDKAFFPDLLIFYHLVTLVATWAQNPDVGRPSRGWGFHPGRVDNAVLREPHPVGEGRECWTETKHESQGAPDLQSSSCGLSSHPL